MENLAHSYDMPTFYSSTIENNINDKNRGKVPLFVWKPYSLRFATLLCIFCYSFAALLAESKARGGRPNF
ncbi:hypothetical protein POVWA1_023200 [Plasmodium ovale wallikeri]|uniref:Uncharacterized protein n=1 Tax=Plasmodium ovale wallikeri TaxID=864142 RepID=A0A1A8YSL5_PLAOA|nr:hypothetical protein POVWA1_023200 [Plasmodium ovale wallikeri]